MPEIKIVSDVAGRVCALPLGVGSAVAGGDDIAFVEAMKMEIPVTSSATGIITSILVARRHGRRRPGDCDRRELAL